MARRQQSSGQQALFRDKYWADHELIRDRLHVPGGPAAKLLLWIMFSRMGFERDTWVASNDELGDACQCSFRTFRRVRKLLKDASLIDYEPIAGRTGWCRYRVIRSNLPDFLERQPVQTPIPKRKRKVAPKPLQAEAEQQAEKPPACNQRREPDIGRTVINQVAEEWNMIEGVRRVSKVTNSRADKLRARLKDPWWREHWREAMARIANNTALKGHNDRNWRANIDWFLRPDTVAKIIEGQYDGWKQRAATNGHGRSMSVGEYNKTAFDAVFGARDE